MVAPTRLPQARGVKCELCKKILASATWLDQTKLAKSLTEPQQVLNLIKQHDSSECPCIPKDIQNLLVGSTYFELHRIIAKILDTDNHGKQAGQLQLDANKTSTPKQTSKTNDLPDQSQNDSTKFKLFSSINDQKDLERFNMQFKYLVKAIDHWRIAVEDQANPFNSKLALRLGLSHHTIYACYLFKYHKILDYQLIAANLLVNLFRSIEGVTANAQLHAFFLYIKSLIDCDQLKLARHYLKVATKYPNYQDKSNYESILLSSVECELDLLDQNGDKTCSLSDLAELSHPCQDDKLQHYYARNLALSVVLRYIQFYNLRSELCYEFYHSLNIIGAMMRRCFEDTYKLLNCSSNSRRKSTGSLETRNCPQILEHSWIRYAVCDYAFSTLDLLSNFLTRAGKPEVLELYYDYLSLVAHRTCSCYWQARISAIGSNLDTICDKYDHARTKLETMSKMIGFTQNSYQMNLLRLDLDVNQLFLLVRQRTVITNDVFVDLQVRLKDSYLALMKKLSLIQLVSVIGRTHQECHSLEFSDVFTNGHSKKFTLLLTKLAVQSLLISDDKEKAREWLTTLSSKISSVKSPTLEYYESQMILETLLFLANIENSNTILLDAIKTDASQLFLESSESNTLQLCQEGLAKISLVDQGDQIHEVAHVDGSNKRKNKTLIKSKSKKAQVKSVGRHCKTYNLENDESYCDIIEALQYCQELTDEDIVVAYLRNCEPNPDYLLYRRAHELMFSFRLKDESRNQLQLLYHFCESISTNSLRYTWMMFECQQQSFNDPSKMKHASQISSQQQPKSYLRHLGFSGILLNSEKSIKSFINSIPDGYDMVQFKYYYDHRFQTEHLLAVRFDNRTSQSNEALYTHSARPVNYSDDFFQDAQAIQSGATSEALALPRRIVDKLEEANKALTVTNNIVRSQKRQDLERDLTALLRERFENDLLGPLRFIICGKVIGNPRYSNFVRDVVAQICDIMKGYNCASTVALTTVIENGPELSRSEFCRLVSMMFIGSVDVDTKAKDCFNLWLKLFEKFLTSENTDKSRFLSSLNRGHIGLILDQSLERIPIESLPIVKKTSQALFRVPSLRLFHVIVSREHRPDSSKCWHQDPLSPKELFYILDPNNDLPKTRQLFESKLVSNASWQGSIGQPPKTSDLEHWLGSKHIYLYIGHGAGSAQYNKLRNNNGLSSMPQIRPLSIIMGCSSGRATSLGPKLESQSIIWTFIFRGGPAYFGLLWDVTDIDIDNFLDSMLSKWVGPSWQASTCDTTTKSSHHELSLAEAATKSRSSCRKYEFLVGASPVLYGLPLWYGKTDN